MDRYLLVYKKYEILKILDLSFECTKMFEPFKIFLKMTSLFISMGDQMILESVGLNLLFF